MTLAEGKASEFAQAPVVARVLALEHLVGGAETYSHGAGFVYVEEGRHRVSFGGRQVELGPRQAVFTPFLVPQTHADLDPVPRESYWFGVGARGGPLQADATYPSGWRQPFQAPVDRPAGTYDFALRATTLQLDGYSAAHRNGGLEVLFVLEGTVMLTTAGATPDFLSKEQGALVPAGTPHQLTNVGATAARYLSFLVTPEGAAVETDLPTAP